MTRTVTISLDIPTSRREQTEITLTPGDIDTPDAEEFFTCSKCHLLACAVNGLTGWPLAHMELHDLATDQTTDIWHVGVINNNGNFVDITGALPIHEAEKVFRANNEGYRTVSTIVSTPVELYPLIGVPSDAPEWWYNDGGFTFDTESSFTFIGDLLTPFAKEVVSRYEWA